MKKIKEGYKITELGEIPNEWEISSLSNITSLITKGTTPMTYGFGFEEEGINFIKVENINESGFLNKSSLLKISDECNNKLLRSQIQENDILMSIAGTLGRTTIISKDVTPANTNQALAIIRVKGQNNISYINKALSSEYIKNHINMIGTVGAQPNLSLKQVGDFKILIPPIKEQEKIASILSTVDEQIDNVDELIQKNKELKKGLMQQLLTKGIRHTKFKKTEIGEIPEEWEVKKLGELSKFIGSGVTPKGGENVYKDSGIPFIRSQNVYPNRLILENVAFIDEVQHEKMKRTEVVEKDVLLNITGASIGRCTYVPVGFGKGNVNQHVCIIRLNECADERFISTVINSPLVKKQIDSFNGGSSREGLNFQQVRAIKIGVPKIEEQISIATIISEVDEKIKEYENKKQKLEELKRGLMQQLLTGKIRV